MFIKSIISRGNFFPTVLIGIYPFSGELVRKANKRIKKNIKNKIRLIFMSKIKERLLVRGPTISRRADT